VAGIAVDFESFALHFKYASNGFLSVFLLGIEVQTFSVSFFPSETEKEYRIRDLKRPGKSK
jgi:hypothetical protein